MVRGNAAGAHLMNQHSRARWPRGVALFAGGEACGPFAPGHLIHFDSIQGISLCCCTHAVTSSPARTPCGLNPWRNNEALRNRRPCPGGVCSFSELKCAVMVRSRDNSQISKRAITTMVAPPEVETQGCLAMCPRCATHHFSARLSPRNGPETEKAMIPLRYNACQISNAYEACLLRLRLSTKPARSRFSRVLECSKKQLT